MDLGLGSIAVGITAASEKVADQLARTFYKDARDYHEPGRCKPLLSMRHREFGLRFPKQSPKPTRGFPALFSTAELVGLNAKGINGRRGECIWRPELANDPADQCVLVRLFTARRVEAKAKNLKWCETEDDPCAMKIVGGVGGGVELMVHSARVADYARHLSRAEPVCLCARRQRGKKGAMGNSREKG